MRYNLKKGFKSTNGQVEIIDSDSLCYVVKNYSRGSFGIRTISKELLNEYVDYFEQHPNRSAADAREELSGTSSIDKFEYGYTSTLMILAKMVLGEQLSAQDKSSGLPYSYGKITKQLLNAPLQLIFFGAPGTGKSHSIKAMSSMFEHYRITFHPDTDYASFVGAYKPSTISIPIRDVSGYPIKQNDEIVTEEKITYKFVQQAFLKAYVAAWKEQQKEQPKPVFLVIEEINRGNCAQIFGDIFQLLDRNEEGFSDYPIHADTDLSKELAKEFKDLSVSNAAAINALYDDKDVVGEVKSGSHLLLPNNLYIWATMNTSDQSLFPIDSAFKRRWDWKYIKITDSGKGYTIAVNGKEYDWWDFLKAINHHIGTQTSQEDKKLGYFFVKATKNAEGKHVISADKFLSKVLFFLYGDVYKDYGFDDAIFQGEDNKPMEFSDYFDEEGNAVETKIEKFLMNLGLNPKTKDLEANSSPIEASTGTKFSVKFLDDDNKIIEGANQSDVFRETVKYIGLDKVEQLGIIYNQSYAIPLLSKPNEDEIKRWSDAVGNKIPIRIDETPYYLATQMPIEAKIKKIEEIAKRLNRSIEIIM